MQAIDSNALKTTDYRIQPHNLDAEEALLGGLLFDPVAIERIPLDFPGKAFYVTSHQRIFEAIKAIHNAGEFPDAVSVMTRLNDSSLLSSVGGQKAIIRLIEQTISAVNVDQMAALILEKYHRRQLIQAAEEIRTLAFDGQKPLSEVMERTEERVFEVSRSRRSTSATSAADVVIQAISELEARSQGLIPPGIESGFYDLDSMTQGFQRSDLVIVAGRPSMGKTAFTINIATAAASKGLPVIVFSLEMDKVKLMQRMLSSYSQVFLGQIVSGSMRDNDWAAIGRAASEIANLPLYLEDLGKIGVSQMTSECREIAAKHGGELGMVVIDYLQLMDGNGKNRVEELSKITRGLKLMAKELNCPVILLSQLNRDVENRTNKRPMMSDLRESGSIEQDADLILMLYRDEYYNPDTPDRGITEVIVCKHRNGPTGTVKLLFEGQFTRFRNLRSAK